MNPPRVILITGGTSVPTQQSINSSAFVDIAPVIATTNSPGFAELPVEFSSGGCKDGSSDQDFCMQQFIEIQ